jgi:ribonuclease HI
MSAQARDALAAWKALLASNPRLHVGDPRPQRVWTVTSDAASGGDGHIAGWGGTITREPGAAVSTVRGSFGRTLPPSEINYLEVVAVRHMVQAAQPPSSTLLSAHTDSQVGTSSLMAGISSDPRINKEIARIFSLLLDFNAPLRVQWLERASNGAADALSKGCVPTPEQLSSAADLAWKDMRVSFHNTQWILREHVCREAPPCLLRALWGQSLRAEKPSFGLTR